MALLSAIERIYIMKKNLHKSHERMWGRFYILYSQLPIKLKILEIDPEKGLSYQRHQKS